MTSILTWARRSTTATVIACAVVLLIGILSVQSSVGLGGLVSELTVGRAGVADSSLLIGNATSSELTVVGFAPAIVTLPAIAPGVETVTLRSRVTSMNGMPTTTGYFTWGYSASTLTNTTATFPITVAGDYGTTITGFVPNERIYYRFYTDADGTAIGDIVGFVPPSGAGGFLLKTLLRIVIAAAIVVMVFIFGVRGGWLAMLVAAIIGIIGFTIIDIFISNLL